MPTVHDSAFEAHMDTDRNLLFGVLALQADLINGQQLAEACITWTARKTVPLADLLVERGWLTPTDKADIERLLRRKLHKHSGDPLASLAEVADEEVKRALAVLDDPEIPDLLSRLPGHNGHVLLSTVAPGTASR